MPLSPLDDVLLWSPNTGGARALRSGLAAQPRVSGGDGVLYAAPLLKTQIGYDPESYTNASEERRLLNLVAADAWEQVGTARPRVPCTGMHWHV